MPTGRGGTKNCQESGTSANDGYPEHTFTWETTLRIRQALTALGVRTAMSRGNDTGLGPCVDERAAMANSLKPNAVVSIHADGGPPTGRGFHVLYSSPPLNQVQAGPSVQFAQVMRDQLQASGLVPSTYIGTDGLNPRSDIAGLNLAQYPSILVELGNMKNPADAGLITTPEGRQKYADAVVRGIAGFLGAQRRVAALDGLLQVVQHLGLNLLQPQRRKRLLEEASDAARALPRRLDRDRRAGSGWCDGPVGHHRRVGVLLDHGVAGDVDVGLDVADPRLGRLQLPARDGARALTALEHLVVAVVRREDLRADRL